MNKDFQKILILWIISIAISALALYSFRDIKFKNTKKLWQELDKKQKIVEEWEELFDKVENTEIPETIRNLNTTWELNIMLPDFLFNTEFKKITDKLEKKWIKTTFTNIENFSQYYNVIKSWLNDNDIYLLPSNWIKWLVLEDINIWENPKPYFHSLFNDIISVNNNKFIPYSIDPIITIVKPNTNILDNWSNIFSYTTLWTQNKKYAMPLMRWIWKNDIRLIEKLSWPFENYFDILYIQIMQIKENNVISELKSMLDNENMSLEYNYKFANFKQLYEIIQKRDENCKTFPAICLMSYGFWDIKFWFLSDFDILNKLFSKNKNNFEIRDFNNSANIYPVKWWVFVVPKNNENINLANEFFKEYLNQSIENNTGLWNNTLSAVNNIYNIQKNDSIYQNLILNENNFKLMYESINLQEEFLKNTNTIEMLKWNYSPELYLKNLK